MIPSQPGTSRWILRAAVSLSAWCVVTAGPLTAHTLAAETVTVTFPISAPVKTLPSSDAQPQQSGPNAALQLQQPPQPTLPDAKLPQYELRDEDHTVRPAEQLQNASLRFILALPAQPILVEATITIDGQPFRMARERRIARILEAAARAEPSDQVAEAPAAGQEPTPTASPYMLASTAEEYVRRYLAATGTSASADEVRWLLAHWVDGPTLLTLHDNFQRFRADQRPVFEVLDLDLDGVVSASELQRAVSSFNRCDLNQDQIVDSTEIAKVAGAPGRERNGRLASGQLFFQIPDAASSDDSFNRLASLYIANEGQPRGSTAVSAVLFRWDIDTNGKFQEDELQALREAEPDVSVEISFHTTAGLESAIAVTGVSSSFKDAATRATVDGSTITLPLPGTPVAFSAIEAGASDQVSIGAIHDGYPLLPAIDPNDDGRFTIRELRGVVDSLRTFDRNQDGRLTADETQAPVRVCFGLGPHVHRELAAVRSVNSPADTPAGAGPEWFVRMDSNRDRDLTRGEFLGTDEQFASLDADEDELISAEEATSFAQQSPTASPAPPSSEPSSEDRE